MDAESEYHRLLLAKWPLIWAAVTLVAASLAFVCLSPRPCLQVEQCKTTFVEASSSFNGHAVCGLITVFLHELTALWLNFRSARPIFGLIADIEHVFLPPLLLCITFAVLAVENSLFMTEDAAAFAQASFQGAGDSRPVFTVIYVEWLINVPLLIVLVGKCALGRSLRQLHWPVVVTNLYIIIAWSAHSVSDTSVAWALVVVSFVMYGWSSFKMCRWVIEYLRSAEREAPSRWLRSSLAVGLVLIFGVYGGVYLIGFMGRVSVGLEKLLFLCMNISVKLVMSMAFAGVRSSEYHDLLVDMLINKNVAFQRQVAISGITSIEERSQSSDHDLQKPGAAPVEGGTLAEPLLKVKES
mmetsp:Transcript_13116/g.30767  ORF Transcript_13116/g.30767 Transcript_13116/m.30767 type:complete len:354 (-) Transcript_13116:341-1402(-)